MKKKIVGLSCGALALTVGTGVILASLLSHNEDNIVNINSKEVPIGKEGFIKENIANLLDYKIVHDNFFHCVNQKIIPNEEGIKLQCFTAIKGAINKISKFNINIDRYLIYINYKIDGKKILFDVVWYLPTTNPTKYYDQFEVIYY